MNTTIRDVANLAGTSTATVSKVLNGSSSISAATAERVKAAMNQLDYTPNRRAQAFARRATHSIVFVTRLDRDTAFINPHMFEIMSGVQNRLRDNGYAMRLMGQQDSETDTIENIISEKSADGLILHASVVTRELAKLLSQCSFPHVVIGKPDFKNHLCWIDNNNLVSGSMAAAHLANCGRTEFAFLGGFQENAISESRLQGAEKELSENRSGFQGIHVMRGESTHTDGFRMMNALLDRFPHTDCVICANNALAFGCVNAIRERGLDIPQDIAVVTFDDYPFSRITDPPLTVVNIDVYDLGCQAASLMLDKIRRPNLHFQTFITLPVLIIRGSTVC